MRDMRLLYAFVLLRKATEEKLASINTTVSVSQKETKIIITGGGKHTLSG